MKENELEKFIEKYKEGDSTLQEEKLFFNRTHSSEPSIEAWSNFVQSNQIEAPKDLNNTLWESFQKKKTRKRKKMIGAWSVAATIAVLISFLILKLGQQEQSFTEKERLLSEALALFDPLKETEIQQKIFYENEMIVVYTHSE